MTVDSLSWLSCDKGTENLSIQEILAEKGGFFKQFQPYMLSNP